MSKGRKSMQLGKIYELHCFVAISNLLSFTHFPTKSVFPIFQSSQKKLSFFIPPLYISEI